MAAGLLLRNKLLYQDVDFVEDSFWTWLKFRDEYLKKILKQKGDLVCSYCGKPHLEVGGLTPQELIQNNKNPNLATIDHITALANGGAKYDETNLTVSCKNCNKNKGTKEVGAFKEKMAL